MDQAHYQTDHGSSILSLDEIDYEINFELLLLAGILSSECRMVKCPVICTRHDFILHDINSLQ